MEEDSNAEAGEGRAWTKENIGQNHTNPTQGGKKGVSHGLAGVRKAARERKGERFTALLHHLTLEILQASFYALKREAAAGAGEVAGLERGASQAYARTDCRNRRMTQDGSSRLLPISCHSRQHCQYGHISEEAQQTMAKCHSSTRSAWAPELG